MRNLESEAITDQGGMNFKVTAHSKGWKKFLN